MRDDDPGARAGKEARRRRTDAADNECEPAVEGGWHGVSLYLIGGMGRLASPGCITKV
jgi:hypothetical protein